MAYQISALLVFLDQFANSHPAIKTQMTSLAVVHVFAFFADTDSSKAYPAATSIAAHFIVGKEWRRGMECFDSSFPLHYAYPWLLVTTWMITDDSFCDLADPGTALNAKRQFHTCFDEVLP